jgi:hypothetical protein
LTKCRLDRNDASFHCVGDFKFGPCLYGRYVSNFSRDDDDRNIPDDYLFTISNKTFLHEKLNIWSKNAPANFLIKAKDKISGLSYERFKIGEFFVKEKTIEKTGRKIVDQAKANGKNLGNV